MGKDFTNSIELQGLKKENTFQKNRILELEGMVQGNGNLSSIPLNQIKLTDNIRDDYQHEEIPVLAEDIKKNGQLQPVLISKDNYLLAGYRRFKAIELLKDKEILVNVYTKYLHEISQDERVNIQMAENEQRRQIDNFQLSKLYLSLAEKGYTQQMIANRFKKSKGTISLFFSLNDIMLSLVDLLKEIQVYGVTKKKFDGLNMGANPDELGKGIIGIKTLYQIAKQETFPDQCRVFIKLFGNKLSEEELKSELFRGLIEDKQKEPVIIAKKQLKGITKTIKVLSETEGLNDDVVKEISKHIDKVEKLLEKL
jgi:ParB/RepB/Spo0J family partition protein